MTLKETQIDIQLGNISHIIQLAIAPVFLLTGVGTNMVVLTNRLARIIDRSRVLEDRFPQANEQAQQHFETELRTLYQRSHLIHRSITLSTSSALLVCIVIATLFLGDALDLKLAKLIAALFVVAMLTLIGSFVYFLREIFIATASVTVRKPLAPKMR